MKITLNPVDELKEYKLCDYEPIVVNEFKEKSCEEFCKKFHQLETHFEVIPIIIDSYGGNVHSLLSMAESILSTDRTVLTYLRGKAMSAGAMLTCLGTEGYRFMGKNSYMMFHQVSNFLFGDLSDLKQSMEHTKVLQDKIFSMVEKNTKNKRGFLSEKLKEKAENSDWYLDAKEAKKYNFVNHIGQPSIDIKMETMYEVSTT